MASAQTPFVLVFCSLGPKEIPVVPVSHREKIRVCRSEKIFFKYVFHDVSGFEYTVQ